MLARRWFSRHAGWLRCTILPPKLYSERNHDLSVASGLGPGISCFDCYLCYVHDNNIPKHRRWQTHQSFGWPVDSYMSGHWSIFAQITLVVALFSNPTRQRKYRDVLLKVMGACGDRYGSPTA